MLLATPFIKVINFYELALMALAIPIFRRILSSRSGAISWTSNYNVTKVPLRMFLLHKFESVLFRNKFIVLVLCYQKK